MAVSRNMLTFLDLACGRDREPRTWADIVITCDGVGVARWKVLTYQQRVQLATATSGPNGNICSFECLLADYRTNGEH